MKHTNNNGLIPPAPSAPLTALWIDSFYCYKHRFASGSKAAKPQNELLTSDGDKTSGRSKLDCSQRRMYCTHSSASACGAGYCVRRRRPWTSLVDSHSTKNVFPTTLRYYTHPWQDRKQGPNEAYSNDTDISPPWNNIRTPSSQSDHLDPFRRPP